MKRLIIAIDGPAASGKSTTAKLLAQRLGYVYIDTGAMYRCCGLAARAAGINLADEGALTDLMRRIDIQILYRVDGNRILLNGEDVTAAIRTEDMGRLASDISTHRVVRERMVALQQQMGKSGGIVMDGRDIGTVVFPAADVKFFMTASVEARAQRRVLELQQKGQKPDYQTVLEEMRLRDLQDSTRALAPLQPAADAILIDNTGMTIEEQVEALMDRISALLDR